MTTTSPSGDGPVGPKPVVHSVTKSSPPGPNASDVMAVNPVAYTDRAPVRGSNRYTVAAPGPPSKLSVPMYRSPPGPQANDVGTGWPVVDNTAPSEVVPF